MTAFWILLWGGVILTIGDIAAKHWTVSKKKIFYICALLLYLFGLNFLIASFKLKDIAAASITIEIFNIAILALIGVHLYKERISRTEILGIMVGIISVVILEI